MASVYALLYYVILLLLESGMKI